MKNCIFATAGHIDHGKTTLIKSLTGIDTDRLDEEKKRGITIDLGYAHLEESGTLINFIDVPGHEKFIRNMLAGAGTVDAVLMIIAADESLKPQTREHYEICRLLDLKRGVIALTKKDLVDSEVLGSIVNEVRDYLENGFLKNAKIIPINNKNGEGIEELRREIIDIANTIEEPAIGDIFRLPVDRSFSVQGYGTVVTGSLIQGRVRVGESVEIFPSRRKFSVRGIQVFNQSVDFAEKGQRTALNIQKAVRDDFKRGDILTNTDYFSGSKEIEVVVELLDDYSKSIGNDKFIKFYHLSEERIARLLLLERHKPLKGEKCACRLLFDDIVLTLPHDRFILRKLNPVETIGGGVVIFNKGAKRSAIEINDQFVRLKEDPKSAVFYLIEERGSRGITLKDLRASSGIDTTFLNDYTSQLRDEGKIVLIAPAFLYASLNSLLQMKDEVLVLLEGFHKSNPSKPGLSTLEMIESLTVKPEPQLVNLILSELVKEKQIVIDKQYYSLTDFKRNFDLTKSDNADRIEEIIKKAGFSPPAVRELSTSVNLSEGMTKKMLKELSKDGKLVEIGSDYFVHSEALNSFIEELMVKYTEESELGVAEFKKVVPASRKFLIPLLEYLDKRGITLRLSNGNRKIKYGSK